MLGKNLLLSDVCHDPAINSINFLGPIGNIHVDTLVLTWTCMGLVLIGALALKPALVAEGAGGNAQGAVEGLYKFLDELAAGQIGHHYKKYFPLVAAIFIFVLTANLIGIALEGA